jgi:hypothetical protein
MASQIFVYRQYGKAYSKNRRNTLNSIPASFRGLSCAFEEDAVLFQFRSSSGPFLLEFRVVRIVIKIKVVPISEESE